MYVIRRLHSVYPDSRQAALLESLFPSVFISGGILLSDDASKR